jgi:hypothetical protein
VSRVFLLSPANCSGIRARQLLSDRASFDLAARLRSSEGAPLGEVFAFISGLYFRGKLAYARHFAQPPDASADPVAENGVFIITPGAGLRSPDTAITRDAVARFGTIGIDLVNDTYRKPLVASARSLCRALEPCAEIVLLGSIASPKYVDVLGDIFGNRLLFPREFVGRGDMSRGGLMLRHVASGQELDYTPVQGAIRHGARPPKLAPLRKISAPSSGQ